MLDIIKNRRTIRHFSKTPIEHSILVSLVDAARLAPSAANLQPLKFMIIDGDKADKMFPLTRWAGYLKGEAPDETDSPVAYILILADTEISSKGYELDAGAAGMSIILSAAAFGVASCWLGAIDRKKIAETFAIDKRFVINSAIALGRPLEGAKTTEMAGGDVKYFRNSEGEFCVPKRPLSEVLL